MTSVFRVLCSYRTSLYTSLQGRLARLVYLFQMLLFSRFVFVRYLYVGQHFGHLGDRHARAARVITIMLCRAHIRRINVHIDHPRFPVNYYAFAAVSSFSSDYPRITLTPNTSTVPVWYGDAENARDRTNTPRLVGWVVFSRARYHIHANRARNCAAETHFTALGMSGMDTPMDRTRDAGIRSSLEARQLAWFPRIVGQCCDDLH